MDSVGSVVNIPEVLANAPRVKLDIGHVVFRPGDRCENFYFLLKGNIRVDLIARSGKPLTLYRFGAGETCILTTSCLLSAQDYSAEATVECEIEAAVLPVSNFRKLLNISPEFRDLVFSTFSARLSELMAKIEALTSRPIGERLARRLLNLHISGRSIRVTHDQLANDLGTAREVVSRKLADWDKQGLIKRSRGVVTVLDEKRLLRKIEES